MLTLDKDFGELAFRKQLPASSGIILFRVEIGNPAQLANMVLTVVNSRSDWEGHFAVVEQDRIRMTPLPVIGSQ